VFAVLFAGNAFTFNAGSFSGNALFLCQPVSLGLGDLCTLGLKFGLVLALLVNAGLFCRALGFFNRLLT
jgi:hypothetical protein